MTPRCPKCRIALPNADSIHCPECGWTRKAPADPSANQPRFSLPCQFPGCTAVAKHRARAGGSHAKGWQYLNVCDRHDIYLATRSALEHLRTG